MHVGRDERLPIALYTDADASIVSPAYKTFKVRDKEEILPEYLMIFFSVVSSIVLLGIYAIQVFVVA